MKQILAITGMNIRTILQRSGASIVIIIGIAGSVAVMVSLLAMAEGLSKTIASTGQEDRALIFREGSNSEMSSGIAMTDLAIIENTQGIKKSEDGPMIAAEIFTIIDLKKKGAVDTSNLPLRGVQEMSFKIRPELKIIEGKNFFPGKGEIIVGKGAANEYEGLELGNKIKIRDSEWTVVGIFSTGGDVHESEIWADLAVTQGAFRRGASASIAIVQMEENASITDLGATLELDPRLDLKVQGEVDFYEEQSSGASSLIQAFGYTVAVIMAIGAVFAALNTMYSAVSTRLVEIGTLRAVGFHGSSVLFALMIESMFLALLGGLLGAGLSYLIFNGYTVSTLASVSFTQTAFDFAVTGEIIGQGLILALIVGFLGGVLPARRAATQDITEALRAI
ncbi:MAG: ABC transporter permease [SAR86 cluster bacterium]|jgi:putative ABC transport system permease protein|uniref:ABC3 transporter permease protein domain-containing protein n=1 Tax=marine metagenome TaxID=408172 RepID=A0A381P5H8_9ZZZZ|tara:strand:- start:286 stop:1464 length:1179 start_codon:yes stop_codon:yes gene_type:complete